MFFQKISLKKIKAYTQDEIDVIVTVRHNAIALQIEQIRNNTKKQIEALNVKYALSGTFKTTCGYIAIIVLSSLVMLVIINECINFANFLLYKRKPLKKAARPNKMKPEKLNQNVQKPVYVPRSKLAEN